MLRRGELLERGRRVALAIGAIVAGAEALILLAFLIRFGSDHTGAPMVRLTLTLVLLLYLYEGRSWARWVLFALLMLGIWLGIGELRVSIAALKVEWPIILLLLGYMWCARMLLYSRTLKLYMRRKRSPPHRGRQSAAAAWPLSG